MGPRVQTKLTPYRGGGTSVRSGAGQATRTPLPPPGERRITEYVRNETFKGSWGQIAQGVWHGSQLVGTHAGSGMLVGIGSALGAFSSLFSSHAAAEVWGRACIAATCAFGGGVAPALLSVSRMRRLSEHVSVFLLNRTVASHTYVVRNAAGDELTRVAAGDPVLECHLDESTLKKRLQAIPRQEWGGAFARILRGEWLPVFERASVLMEQHDLRALRLWAYLPPRYLTWCDDCLVTETRLSEASPVQAGGWRALAVRAIQLSTEVFRFTQLSSHKTAARAAASFVQLVSHRTVARAIASLEQFLLDDTSGFLSEQSDTATSPKRKPWTYPHQTRIILRDDLPLMLDRLRALRF